jgi:hypothetical protein
VARRFVKKAVMRFEWFAKCNTKFNVKVIVVFDGKAQQLKERETLRREM